MEFRILGPVEVRQDGCARSIGGGRDRYVLAVLLLNVGRSTSAARLIDALWDEPPPSAKAQLHNMISRLRRGIDAGRDDLIVTSTTGYELRLTEHDSLDLTDFRRLVAQGLRADDPSVAVALLGEALSLWHGPALADIPDELAAATRHGLHEERLAAAEARLGAELSLGRHPEVLRELTPLLAEYPYRENLYQTRMLAQLAAGRRAEALETYRRAYRTLADGLGIEPGPALRDLEGRILRGEDVPAQPAPASRVVARQLPPLTAVLTGRDKLVGEVRAELLRCGTDSPVVAVLVGPGGVGKTAVALAAAGAAAEEFSGGQLYADLRGSQETPADPHLVIGRFLHALGVRQSKLPADPDERVGMYRSLLARTRTLVVLDDAASEEQVRPLLPGDPGCAALVTSRRLLGAMVGAVRWTVPVLTPGDAQDLLARIVGPARTAEEPEAAAELAAVCGQLPLAVSIVAARLAVRPDWTLEEFRQRLALAQRRGESIPPIEVYRIGDLHFVVDGHHRVSVAHALGLKTIDAYVTEVLTRLSASGIRYRGDLLVKDYRRIFLERVPLSGEARRAVTLTDPWDYAELAESVEAWGFRLMQDEGRYLDRPTVAQRWHDEEFVPVVRMLRQAGMVESQTEAEAYMWVSCERYRLIRTHRWDDEVITAVRETKRR